MLLPAPVVPMDEVALIDAAAVALGQDLAALMESAGAALAHEAHRLAPEGVICVACGPGNNGGDGYVAARLLAAQGRSIAIWTVVDPRSDLCQAQAARLPAGIAQAEGPPPEATLIIDAILGSGQRGEPHGAIADAVRQLRASHLPILAADVPTGLGSNLCAPATLTLCFQVAKRELFAAKGLGEFKTVDIGIRPEAWSEVQPACFTRFPRHRRSGHKGQHGELLVIGGGTFPGALDFACRAAVMSGCDLVRAWTCEGPPLPSTIVAHRQEGGLLAPATNEELTPFLVRAGAVLIGNGLGRHEGSDDAARQGFSLAMELGIPVVVDADAIAVLAGELRDLPADAPPVLVTPHRGEARNLLGVSDDASLHAFARPNLVVLAKAAVDLVTDGRRWQRNPRGNPRMAVGGTGDVLAGLSAGLMARGVGAFDAARMAVLWLCEAGDVLWQEAGPCYDTLDVIRQLPHSLRKLLEPLGAWPPVAD